MKASIHIGTYRLHDELNMNCQANRCYTGGGDLVRLGRGHADLW